MKSILLLESVINKSKAMHYLHGLKDITLDAFEIINWINSKDGNFLWMPSYSF